MAKEESIKARGLVIEALGNAKFRIQLEGTTDTIICMVSGKMRQNKIFVDVKDYVDVELSPYDLARGRIVFRHKIKPKEYRDG